MGSTTEKNTRMTSILNEQRNSNSNHNEVWSLLIKKVNCVWECVCAMAERNVIILKMGAETSEVGKPSLLEE